jgi:hypothetical protein
LTQFARLTLQRYEKLHPQTGFWDILLRFVTNGRSSRPFPVFSARFGMNGIGGRWQSPGLLKRHNGKLVSLSLAQKTHNFYIFRRIVAWLKTGKKN